MSILRTMPTTYVQWKEHLQHFFCPNFVHEKIIMISVTKMLLKEENGHMNMYLLNTVLLNTRIEVLGDKISL